MQLTRSGESSSSRVNVGSDNQSASNIGSSSKRPSSDSDSRSSQTSKSSQLAGNCIRVNRAPKLWEAKVLAKESVYTRFKNFHGPHPATRGPNPASTMPANDDDPSPDLDNDGYPESHDCLSSPTDSAYDSVIASPTSDPGSPVPDDFSVVNLHRRKPHSPWKENESTSPPKSMRKPRDEEVKSARRDRHQETRSKSPSKKLRSTSKNLLNYNADREAKEEYLAARSPPDQQ